MKRLIVHIHCPVRLASHRRYGMVRVSIKHEATVLLIFLRVLECGEGEKLSYKKYCTHDHQL